MSLKALSDYTFISRYAQRHAVELRRESWIEAVERLFTMHRIKYAKEIELNPELGDLIDFAEEQQKKKRVLASQRSLQFAIEPILKHHLKMYNCLFSHADRDRVFQEIMYALLCGCGVGFSVQKHHISQVSNIKPVSTRVKEYIIDDSIEGWADAVGVLMNSYFEDCDEFKDYNGLTVVFDYSQIRPEGSLIANRFKAPGSDGLQKGLEKIVKLIERRLNSEEFKTDEFAGKLRSIDVYDIVMHVSDCVLSGGVRRSATLCMFSADDNDMLNAKIGNWFIDNPQRGRSNNSATLLKGHVTREQFAKVIKSTREFGEPAFIWTHSLEHGYNPCLPRYAKVITKDGIRQFSEIDIGSQIWSKEGWTTVVNKWSTGVKPVYEYKTTGGTFYSTDNHRVVSNGLKIEVKDADSIDVLSGEATGKIDIVTEDVMDGIVFGDGTVHKASGNLVTLCIGEDDKDYFDSEIAELIVKPRPGIGLSNHEIATTITYDELPLTYDRVIPDRYYYGTKSKVASFLRGLYTANGSICGDRVTLKGSSFKVIQQAQEMLSFLGIQSYYTTNKAKNVKFENGEYLCKESYDLNITVDRSKFALIIGFIQGYKQNKLQDIADIKSNSRKVSYDIKEINFIAEEEVFDITVNNSSHTFWCGGFDISNCVEIGMYPKTIDGESGFQSCNLVEINGKYCDSKEKFINACTAASIIGTLQAGYTDLKYLGSASKEIFEHEALLGCSITGWMDNPEILFDQDNQRLGAQTILDVNERVAKMININPSTRATCVKPAGSTSAVLGTASGIHPHHARRYIRRVQVNRTEFCGQVVKRLNPSAVEKSVWSSNGTDDVVSFLCEVPVGAIVKNQMGAVDLLEKIKFTQQNWIEYGTRKLGNTNPKLRHNVSNTVTVKPDEWQDVENFIFDNQEWFAGVSLLPESGDLDYAQAPFSTVLTPTELVKTYGDASVFASGLIVDGLHAFDNDLWSACGKVLGYGNETGDVSEERVDWIRRVNQFAKRYFDGDVRRATYCMKHVSLWKTWCDLKREYVEIDWTKIKEENTEYVNADTLASSACAGGQCEI